MKNMQLANKLVFCRKRAGLSQEALADQIGVSRQAISKWETGESAPEINKLLLLARTFGVTTDWLLSEEEPAEAPREERAAEPAQPGATWVDSIPGVIGKLIRRYGWLYGVYTALAGLGFVVIGALARVLTRSMFSQDPFGMGGLDMGGLDLGGFGGGTIWYDEAGNVISSPLGTQTSSFAANNPVAIMGTVILAIGVVLIVAGVVLALCLKGRGGAEGR